MAKSKKVNFPPRIPEKDLAKYWGVKRNTLQKWRSSGIGPVYIKLGGKVVYPLDAVRAYENRRTFTPTEETKNK